MISYGRQTIDKDDIESVTKILTSDWLTSGSKVAEFEKKFSHYVGSKYAVTVNNGTAGLHLTCLAAGLKKNNELITSSLTFVASANCALYCGAKPVFIDVNDQGLIDENKIKDRITKNTKIIIPVHYAGFPCNLEKIKKLADKHKLIVIEDACHALGARYKNSQIGDCKYSNMAVFSFHPVKHITTGEGGMITTNSKKYYEKLLMLRNHGITRDSSKFKVSTYAKASAGRQSSKLRGVWYYEMQELGFNYRLTDIQCALGISQLEKIDKFVKRRREIAMIYNQVFKNNSKIEIIKENKDQFCAYHLYPIRVKDEKMRFELFNYLKSKDVYCQVHYIPVYWHPYYQKLGYKRGINLKAEKYYQRVISIPIYPLMKNNEIKYVINIIKEFL